MLQTQGREGLALNAVTETPGSGYKAAGTAECPRAGKADTPSSFRGVSGLTESWRSPSQGEGSPCPCALSRGVFPSPASPESGTNACESILHLTGEMFYLERKTSKHIISPVLVLC